MIDDVTERVMREVELQDQVTALEAMHDIGRAILSLDLAECLQRVVQRTSALLGNPMTAVVLQENGALDGARLYLFRAVASRPSNPRAGKRREFGDAVRLAALDSRYSSSGSRGRNDSAALKQPVYCGLTARR